MRLLCAELYKVWSQRFFLLSLAVLAAANLLFLYLGTMPDQGTAPPRAYHVIEEELSNRSTSEQQAFLKEQYDTIHGVYQVHRILSDQAIGVYGNRNVREEFSDIFTSYEEIYQNHTYTLYTGNLQTENFFLKELLDEIDTVSNYSAFLEDLQAKATGLTGISIFQNQGQNGKSYSQKNIEKTAAAYAEMGNVSIDYFPQKGLLTALDYQFTDLILFAAMILLSSLLIRQERDNNMIHVVRSTPGGRLRTAVAKIGALAFSLLVVLTLLYVVNLLYCGLLYGLGPFSRSIQSVPALMHCTMKISVGQYLWRFLLAKWAGTAVMGLWVMLSMLWARRTFVGWCSALALPVLQWLVRCVVPATSNLNVIKYANMASLMRTNELLGNYRNLYWFGTPVALPLVEWLSAVLYSLILIIAVCLLFCRGKMQPAPVFTGFTRKRTKTKATTIFKEEARKLFILSGAALILISFAGYETMQVLQSDRKITAAEVHYENYMREWEGPYTKATYLQMVQESRKFIPLLQMWNAAQHNVEFNQYDENIRYDILIDQYDAFQNIQHNKIGYVVEHPEAQLIYEKGWEKVFGWETDDDLMDTLYAGILCCLCCAGLFSFEKKGGMQKVVLSTPLGRCVTVKRKLQVGVICAAFICFLTYFPRVAHVYRFYWLGRPFAPAMSLPELSHLPSWLPLIGVMLWGIMGRFIACLSMTSMMLWLSDKLASALSALFAGSIVFCIPPMLTLGGLDFLRWVGVYPLFHLAEMVKRPLDNLAGTMCLVIAASIIYLCMTDLYDRWEY